MLLNTECGKDFFGYIKKNLCFCKSVPKEWAVEANPGLISPATPHFNRSNFFDEFPTAENVENLLKEYTNPENYVALLNFHFENSNYGAVLTAYALNKFLNDKGYFAFNIDYHPQWEPPCADSSPFEDFRTRYLPRTHRCATWSELKDLNKVFGTFVVGSDQVFRHQFTDGENGIYYLQFVNDERKKIAYAASFGFPYFEGQEEDCTMLNYLLHRFDALSVREKSGVDLIKKLTGLGSQHVLDPVFLLDKSEYIKLMSSIESKDEIVSYVLNADVRQESTQWASLTKDIRHGLTVEAWVETLHNAKTVITDSFHGTCFSVIFGTPFCVVVNPKSPVERIESLFEMLGLEKDKIVISHPGISLDEILSKRINPTDITETLENIKRSSIKWLQDAMDTPLQPKDALILELERNKKKLILDARIQRFVFKLVSSLTLGKMKKRAKAKVKNAKKLIKFYKQI